MKLVEMKNIGAEMQRKLNTIGIHTADDLTQLGSKETFVRLKPQFPEICLVHLYSLQGAIENTDFNKLSNETKSDLKVFSDSLK